MATVTGFRLVAPGCVDKLTIAPLRGIQPLCPFARFWLLEKNLDKMNPFE
jgi:hypothetical protein